MPDAQSHLGISVLSVTPQRLLRHMAFAAEFMNMPWVDWLLRIRVGTQGRNTWHAGKEYMKAGVRSIMGAQATLQSRCNRNTCGWGLAGLLGSQMNTNVSPAPELWSPSSQNPASPTCLWSTTSSFFWYCWAVCQGARRAGCSQKAGEMGT